MLPFKIKEFILFITCLSVKADSMKLTSDAEQIFCKISRNKNPQTKHLSLKEHIFLGVNLERVAENVGAAILLIC